MTGSLAHKIKNICVFCGSSPGKENKFLELANHFCRILAEKNIHLMCHNLILIHKNEMNEEKLRFRPKQHKLEVLRI